MRSAFYFVMAIFVAFAIISCSEKRTPLQSDNNNNDDHSLFELIEHAAIHMADGPAKIVVADSVRPGTHLDPDSIDHKRLDVVLLQRDTLKGGYIHFGPDAVGDFLVMINSPARVRFVNRKAAGDSFVDSLLEIEETLSAQQIVDSANGITSIKRAFLFEARTGGNILCIDSASVDTLKIVIEEVEHSHE